MASIEWSKVNQMNQEEFVRKVGWVFEHSPWVASAAWKNTPYESHETLLQAMIDIVQRAEESKQLALLRAHPDLGTRLQMSQVSQKEQAGAGLDKLSKEEFEEFVSLNQSYVNKFNFPFIMAVKGQSKETILAAMKQRIHNSYEEEYNIALREVYKIAEFRLNDIFIG
ncbi:2-oxo-4-hydroxy-4-carboxy-5-ureidoimidazoline decarboxylase [Neobacillus sp. DY30]|uniref:2-oxo-4-hydroxy-4-carboxy-5-ureidoimidazoline decarboxylase n=1 Tax=Neobacillus sp. DY30 TaxID=3047871 RepID=UPI0024BFD1AE|nr:2-oxo-4-hydroxy-4-carboxy-5-ureidoimidazoline decarboxylase [Neobacillus sp. DY30]WHY01553.1 2-oxo-4-hydroxy-4-carboxy-5-ureidoimidazoline decarboxylase [Neobacillus sp. DY30]